MLAVMDGEEDLLYRAVMNFLRTVMRMSAIEVSIRLGSHKGPGKCFITTKGMRAFITFKLVEEGTSVNELAASCIEYLGNPWRTYVPAISFSSFIIAVGLQFINPAPLVQMLTIAFVGLGVVFMILSGIYLYGRDKRIKSLVSRYGRISEVDGRVKELYAFFIDAVSYLLDECRGKDKALVNGNKYLKSLWKAHRKTFRIMGLEKPKL